jgi:UPF0716 protein FxsA
VRPVEGNLLRPPSCISSERAYGLREMEAHLFILFLLFTLLPVIELALLIEVGTSLGVLPTIGLCLLTGAIGAWLAKTQGMGVLKRTQATLQQGGMPTRELLDAVMILMAGAVLLTPGFVTDTLGILLLTPLVRAIIRPLLLKHAKLRVEIRGTHGHGPAQAFYQASWTNREEGAPWDSRSVAPKGLPPGQGPRPPSPPSPKIIDHED